MTDDRSKAEAEFAVASGTIYSEDACRRCGDPIVVYEPESDDLPVLPLPRGPWRAAGRAAAGAFEAAGMTFTLEATGMERGDRRQPLVLYRRRSGRRCGFTRSAGARCARRSTRATPRRWYAGPAANSGWRSMATERAIALVRVRAFGGG
jgi:hypothetical protein